MSHEIPSDQLNLAGPNTMTGVAIDLQADQDSELLREGAKELAGSVARLVETGDTSAVKDYLGDVLAGTEGRAPAAERMAAFELLAGEQRSEIQRRLVASGKRMIDTLGGNSQRADQELQQTAPSAQRGIQMIGGAHEREVGPYVHGRADIRGAAQGHAVAARVMRQGFGLVSKRGDVLGEWARAQQQETRQYEEQVRQGEDHERALSEASEVVMPGYEGEPKDISNVIDKDVMEAAATKLQLMIAEAQGSEESLEDSALKLLAEETDDSKVEIIDRLRTFAEQYGDSTKTLQVGEMTGVSDLLKRFEVQGRNGYQETPDKAALYKKQEQIAQEAAERASSIVRQGEQIFDTADTELQRMQQELAAT